MALSVWGCKRWIFFFYFDIIFEVIIVFFRYDRLVLEQEAKQKEWDVKENEHLQRKEEIEKLFEQVMTQNDKIHSQVEAMTDLERQKTELKFEVCKEL